MKPPPLFCLLWPFLAIPLQAADWPEFQGEGRQNVWTETGILQSFAAGGLRQKWSTPVAAGYGGPTVAGDSVFLMDRPDESHERIVCVNRETGASRWIHAYDCRYGQVGYGYGPRGSVTIRNGRAYAMGTMGNLHCLDAATGEVLWAKDLMASYKVDLPIWGLTNSPLVEGNHVIVQASAGEEGACLVAFDKANGAEKWRAFGDKASYVSPIMIQQAGKRVLVAWTGFRIAGMNAVTGEVYWEIETRPRKMPINVPGPALNAAGDRMFLSVFYDGSRMIELDQTAPKARQLWARAGMNEHKTDALHAMISPPCFQGDHIYGIDSYGQMRCLDPTTGDRIWEDQTATAYGRWSTVFMVRHGDHTWILNEQGDLILAKLSPQGYHEISRAKVIEPTTPLPQRESGAVLWSPPAYANRCVYLRNDRELICVDLAE
ncbi:MAG: PQQ-binding-like beta-propeller repeat protein [Verrucomicrobiales bacterium]